MDVAIPAEKSVAPYFMLLYIYNLLIQFNRVFHLTPPTFGRFTALIAVFFIKSTSEPQIHKKNNPLYFFHTFPSSSISFYYEFSKDQDYICSKPEDSGMHLCGLHLPQYRIGNRTCNGELPQRSAACLLLGAINSLPILQTG